MFLSLVTLVSAECFHQEENVRNAWRLKYDATSRRDSGSVSEETGCCFLRNMILCHVWTVWTNIFNSQVLKPRSSVHPHGFVFIHLLIPSVYIAGFIKSDSFPVQPVGPFLTDSVPNFVGRTSSWHRDLFASCRWCGPGVFIEPWASEITDTSSWISRYKEKVKPCRLEVEQVDLRLVSITVLDLAGSTDLIRYRSIPRNLIIPATWMKSRSHLISN